MKISCRSFAFLLGKVLTLPLAAAPITWEQAVDTVDASSISTAGSLIEAFNGTSSHGNVTINGVDFLPSNTLLPLNAASVALDFRSTPDPGLDRLLNELEYGGGTAVSITVGQGRLAIGQRYAIQLFFTDLRSCCRGRVMTYGDGLGNTVEVAASGDPGTFGQSALGTFVADDTSQTIRLLANGFGNVHLNGYQLRSVFPAPVIDSFTANPARLASGEGTTLQWQITGADRAEIDQRKGPVDAASGTLVVFPEATTTYRLQASNDGGSVTSEVTVGVDVPILPPVLNEFLAKNDGGLKDDQGRDSDWIEIYNPNPFAIDLDGYHLTSDLANPTEWTFPPGVLLDGHSYLIVFASGDNRGLPELHTNFKIPASGGDLALVDRDGRTVLAEFSGLSQRSNVSHGPEGYFSPPTPGEANGEGKSGFVADTKFDHDRGFYQSAFTVRVTTATAGATVVCTTDGTAPSLSNGTAAGELAEVAIAGTTVLRAAAFKAGFLATDIDTQTYLFPSDIIRQARMDPEVVNDPAYRDEVASALTSIRTLSLVTDPDHLFDGGTGILANTRGRGRAWERPVSLEFLSPGDPGNSMQTDAGLRVHGNGSRGNPKNSLRLLFRADYGPKKLNYPLFGEDFVTQKFNTVVLRAQNANSWTSNRALDRQSTTFLQDSFAKDTQGAMGQPTAGSTFVHLFLNGTYWGLYNPTERPDGSFGEDHFGGDDADYDAVNRRFSVEVLSGSKSHWDEMIAFSNTLLDTEAEYQGLREEYIDVDNLIDYMLVHQFMQTRDGPDDFGHNNMRLVRRNNPPGLWRAYVWDMEYSMIDDFGTRNYSYPFPIYSSSRNSNNDITDSIASIYLRLKDHNPEFQLRYADRAYRHLFHGGVLAPEQARARFEARAEEIADAVIAESARWGDERRAHPYTRDGEWTAERNRINGEFFPARSDHVISQLRRHGLYPAVNPPVFSQHGGEVAAGSELRLSADGGTIYFTVDGSDPREAWTGIAVGTVYSSPLVVSESLTVKARTLEAGEWSALAEAHFVVGTPADATNLVVSELHYHPSAGQEGREFIELLNISRETIELGGASFSDGLDFTFAPNTRLRPGERILIVKDRASFTATEQIDLAGSFANDTGLNNGGERLVLLDYRGEPIFDFTYRDDRRWSTFPDGEGPSLTVIAPETLPDLSDPASWRPSSHPGGTPGDTDATLFAGDPHADDNKNGVSNLMEYALGDRLFTGFRTIDGERLFTVEFERNLGADDVVVTLEASSDLITWNPVTPSSTTVYHADGTSTVSMRSDQNPVQRHAFLRVRVTAR